MALPITKGFADTLSAPRAGADTVTLAPPSAAPQSKYAEDAHDVDEGMVGVMQELRLGVVQRNQVLQEELDVIKGRREAALNTLLHSIIPQREAGMARQRREIQEALASLERDVNSRIAATFGAHNSSLLPIAAKLDRDEATEEQFYFRDIPERNEKQTGEAVATMEREREALVLDNATIAAREAKINKRLDDHVARFRERAAAELSDRKAQHALWEGMFSSAVSSWENSARREESEITASLDALKASLAREEEARRAADALSVVTVKAAMIKVREEAIKNFGEEAPGGGEGKEEEDEEDD